MYSLDCECLRLAERRRLDAFHFRCLRVLCNIPHSMISRVTNLEELAVAGAQPLRKMLEKRQLLLFGRIAAMPHTNLARTVALEPDQVKPTGANGPRRRGRPRMNWVRVQHAKALSMVSGNQATLDLLFASPNFSQQLWRMMVEAQ